jgi:tripartite-type tricarboxylate transporter receptor subunit TctC
MPGGGSIIAGNHVYNIAAKDGTILGAISQGGPLQAKLQPSTVKFDPAKFGWIGRVSSSANVTFVWHTSSIKTLDDAKKREVTLGATGAGSTVSLYPSVMNSILGTKFKNIMGYKGSAEAMLAIERGEVESHSTTWEAVKAVHLDWVKDNKIRILVQHSLKRHPELPNVPTSVELTTKPEDLAVMRVIMGASEIGKSYFTAPDVPKDRLEALRRAFDQMVKDPEFAASLEKIHGEIDPMTGEEVQKLVGELDTMTPELLARVQATYRDD